MTAIKVLAVRQPWASLIVKGFKQMEIRSQNTNVRGPVLIYASNYLYSIKEKKYLYEHFKSLLDNDLITDYMYNYACSSVLSGGERGKIIGKVDLYAVEPMIVFGDTHDLNEFKHMHLAPNWLFDYKKDYFFWELENPVKFSEPIPYKPPKGAVVWSNFDLPEEYL